MDITRLLVQVVIAFVCAGIANLVVPRQVPGKILGLVVIGLVGVVLGEWVVNFLADEYSFRLDLLDYQLQGVAIIPAIIGSVIVLYVVTAFLSWGRYGGRS